MEAQSNCPDCGEKINADAQYCYRCGTKLRSISTPEEIDTYVRGRVKQELSAKIADKDVVVSSIADKAEQLIWDRGKRYFLISLPLIGLIVFILGFVGIKTYRDAIVGVKSTSKDAIHQINDASKKVELERNIISQTSAQARDLKARTDQLAKDIQTQVDRMQRQGGDIDQEKINFDQMGQKVQEKLRTQLARAAELSKQLDTVANSLQTSAGQISQRAQTVGIEQAFPGLGVKPYVTIRGTKWTNANAKKEGRESIYFYIHPFVIPNLTKSQVENAVSAMKDLGIDVEYDAPGIAGPVNIDLNTMWSLGNIVYFHRNGEVKASTLSQTLSKIFGRKIDSVFVDPDQQNDQQKMILKTTDLDFELVIFPL